MEGKRPSFVKPTLDTPFHIDYDWWQKKDNSWRVHLRSALCEAHQEQSADWEDGQMVDWVDPDTAEVKPLDGIQHVLMTHCALQDDFLTEHTALVEAAFRVFLTNGNTPLSSQEISVRLRRPAETIMRTLTASGIYKGLRLFIA
jgi:hypothetical protein